LGLVGLGLWIAIILLIAHRLIQAYQTLPDDDLCGKPLVLVAISAFVILLISGLTVDLRFFDFTGSLIYLIVGAAVGWSDRLRRNNG
jgi:hypothetical protein